MFESSVVSQPEFGNGHLGSERLNKTGEDMTDFSANDKHCSTPPGHNGPQSEIEHQKTETQRSVCLQEHPTSSFDATPAIGTLTLVTEDPGNLGANLVENNKDAQNSSQVIHKSSTRANKTIRKPKGRSFNARKSLAEAGTKWESGLRRSTRNRFRPLEFWRGEKLLYGRVHESLATVIGIKYSSPGAGALKVKSYVSDEYADLLKQVSLH